MVSTTYLVPQLLKGRKDTANMGKFSVQKAQVHFKYTMFTQECQRRDFPKMYVRSIGGSITKKK